MGQHGMIWMPGIPEFDRQSGLWHKGKPSSAKGRLGGMNASASGAKRKSRAEALARCDTIAAAVRSGALEQFQDVSVSEALVLGLLNQGVRKYIGVFGHGSTDVAEVLRIYERFGLVKTYNVRHETAAAHAVTALKWQTGETAAVVTSIGPGALQACAGALVSASNGVGVYHLYGDETTHDEGPNLQQIPGHEQCLFLKLFGVMGDAYTLHEPKALFSALRKGAICTGSAGFNKPFFMLLPMNVQPAMIRQCNLLELPGASSPGLVRCSDDGVFERAAQMAREAQRITIKIGGGSRGCGEEIVALADILDAAIVSGPNVTGVVPYSEPRYMAVGGSKGSICGNYCMNEADLVIVVGARAVCQWDCSGTAWKKAERIINFNTDPLHAGHYNRSLPIVGDARANLKRWLETLKKQGFKPRDGASEWFRSLSAKRKEWETFKNARYDSPTLEDPVWGESVLTQPAAIKIACDFADSVGAVKYFDAGDVQANGFQIVEDQQEDQTVTDTGASYMGFAPSALLAGALRDDDQYGVAFCGDGSFWMNPQILLDGVEHGVKGCVIVLDNRRMAAITGLQIAQYGQEYKTGDSVTVDYVAWAEAVNGVKGIFGGTTPEAFTSALKEVRAYNGLSLIHLPVYCGPDEFGGLGAYGDWNVGSWCDRVQKEHHRIGL